MDPVLERKQLLWCGICGQRFTLGDIALGLYAAETGICKDCYWKMAKDVQTCFGKEKMYDQSTLECGTFCPDRKICPSFITIQKGLRTG